MGRGDTFVDVTLWGRTAEVASEYLSKGSPVFIEGRLKLDTWEGQDGQKRSKLKVVVRADADDRRKAAAGRPARVAARGRAARQARNPGTAKPAPPDDYQDAPPAGEPPAATISRSDVRG